VTRYERLNDPARVRLVEAIAELARDEEKRSGAPILYMTQWDIADVLGVDHIEVANAMRLSYTAEFLAEYGYGFVSPGGGRWGSVHGYVLQYGRNRAAAATIKKHLKDTDGKIVDHLFGAAASFEHLSQAHGRKSRTAKLARETADTLIQAAQLAHSTLNGQP
jgi:hypothetical protein